ncbi:MAG: AbrB/MazE/SpoVT family DNA-binding domain-containing protein [Planctomycetes bacterium]|nr:AbrB/MazE/SpoVT family DNA-binding domain-containing protein [Planctomycetota bacterium]
MTKIRKWGNSLGVRIPKSLATDVRVEDGCSVDLSIENGRLVIVPIAQDGQNLDELLDQITPQNLHGELETGKPVGGEVW